MALFFLYSILYGWGTISDLFFGVLSRDKLVLYKDLFSRHIEAVIGLIP